MTLFMLGVVTSIFTADAGGEGHIITAHGCLLTGEVSHQLYSGTGLAKSDITVTWSLDDLSTTERTMIDDEYTDLNIVVKEGKGRTGKNAGRIIPNAEIAQAVCVFVFQPPN